MPARAGGPRVGLLVDARGRPYTWTVRRVGGATIRRGRADRPQIATEAARLATAASTCSRRAAARAPRGRCRSRSTTPAHHRVLVVLPLMTWQGRNPVDDDGDGCRTRSSAGAGAKLAAGLRRRPLPATFAAREAPVLI